MYLLQKSPIYIFFLLGNGDLYLASGLTYWLPFLWNAEHGDRIAGFLFEPIQGEAGVCMIGHKSFYTTDG